MRNPETFYYKVDVQTVILGWDEYVRLRDLGFIGANTWYNDGSFRLNQETFDEALSALNEHDSHLEKSTS